MISKLKEVVTVFTYFDTVPKQCNLEVQENFVTIVAHTLHYFCNSSKGILIWDVQYLIFFPINTLSNHNKK